MHGHACTRILGEINAFANSTRGNTTMGARGGGGEQEEALNRPHPLEKSRKFSSRYMGKFLLHLNLHVGAFLLRFSHYSYSSQRGGGQ